MALWVISSTKYIHAARCLRRSLRLGGRKTSPTERRSVVNPFLIDLFSAKLDTLSTAKAADAR
jgi:hypothetical protein